MQLSKAQCARMGPIPMISGVIIVVVRKASDWIKTLDLNLSEFKLWKENYFFKLKTFCSMDSLLACFKSSFCLRLSAVFYFYRLLSTCSSVPVLQYLLPQYINHKPKGTVLTKASQMVCKLTQVNVLDLCGVKYVILCIQEIPESNPAIRFVDFDFSINK